MAIVFKPAPAPAASDGSGSGGFDIVALLEEGGKLNIAMLVVAVAVIYCVVLYLRATPGHRITDIRLKRGAAKDTAVKRIRAPTDEEVRAAEQSNA